MGAFRYNRDVKDREDVPGKALAIGFGLLLGAIPWGEGDAYCRPSMKQAFDKGKEI